MDHGYILGIGANLAPEKNIPRLLEHLLRRFCRIKISRFYETAPVGMESERQFINFCAFVGTELELDACKAVCVGIEVELGRDRTHPFSKTRDRAADIDLLTRVDADGHQAQLQPVPDYLVQPAAEILAILSPGRTFLAAHGCVRTFTIDELRLGEAPTTIDRDARTGLVVIG